MRKIPDLTTLPPDLTPNVTPRDIREDSNSQVTKVLRMRVERTIGVAAQPRVAGPGRSVPANTVLPVWRVRGDLHVLGAAPHPLSVVHQWALDLRCLVVANGPSELSLRDGKSPCSRDKLRKVRQVDSLRGEMCCVRAPVVQKNGDDLEQLFAIALISCQERELDEFLPSKCPDIVCVQRSEECAYEGRFGEAMPPTCLQIPGPLLLDACSFPSGHGATTG